MVYKFLKIWCQQKNTVKKKDKQILSTTLTNSQLQSQISTRSPEEITTQPDSQLQSHISTRSPEEIVFEYREKGGRKDGGKPLKGNLDDILTARLTQLNELRAKDMPTGKTKSIAEVCNCAGFTYHPQPEYDIYMVQECIKKEEEKT